MYMYVYVGVGGGVVNESNFFHHQTGCIDRFHHHHQRHLTTPLKHKRYKRFGHTHDSIDGQFNSEKNIYIFIYIFT